VDFVIFKTKIYEREIQNLIPVDPMTKIHQYEILEDSHFRNDSDLSAAGRIKHNIKN
jgi:hypothetical protein